ncbi:DUF3883 domain-containing protein [Streptosporangium sp. NPDC020072]|uniref:protein NO VEIN domain-containing protein n=1 Tax=Streptosporangium sp. NPDC020072 TaxID=3154788 RepID=UPI003431F6B7
MRLRLEVPSFTLADVDQLAYELASNSTIREPQVEPLLTLPQQAVTLQNSDEDLYKNAAETPRHPRYMQDARLRQAVERHAVKRAVEHYEGLGYRVKDVGTRRSYDLHAVRDTTVLHIEVKGSTDVAKSVELTTNEVDNARAHPTDLVVVDQIKRIDNGGEVPDLEGGRLRIWERWQPANDDLRPVRFNYRITGDGSASR